MICEPMATPWVLTGNGIVGGRSARVVGVLVVIVIGRGSDVPTFVISTERSDERSNQGSKTTSVDPASAIAPEGAA